MPTLTANSRAQLSPDELHQLRWLLGLVLALLAFWTLFSLDTDAVTLSWLRVAVVVVVACLLFPRLPGFIPAWMWKYSTPFVIAAVVADFLLRRLDILPALVETVSALAFYRCVQYRRRREDLQLVLLCLFMSVLAGVLTLSLLFGFQILLFAVIAMALLFVVNLVAPTAARSLTAADWKHFRWRRFLGRIYGVLNLRLLCLSGLLFAAMVAVSTVIFVAMPRFSFDRSFSFAKLKGHSGFSTNIDYGKVNQTELDNAIAFRVDVPPDLPHPESIFDKTPYWRMVVLDQYDGAPTNGFRQSNGLIPHSPAFADAKSPIYQKGAHYYNPSFQSSEELTKPGVWVLYLEGDVSEYLPVLGSFQSLVFNAPQSFSANNTLRTVRLEEVPTTAIGYKIDKMDIGDYFPVIDEDEKNALNGLKESRTGSLLSQGYPNTTLALPKNDDDYNYLKQAVDELRHGEADKSAEDFKYKAIKYLLANHAYSLTTQPVPPGYTGDALVYWLKKKGSNQEGGGWCEHFAGAFALLARAAGYPARVIGGFKEASYNSIQNYYVVRQSQAHAWVEIYDRANARWLRADPTPGGESPFPGDNSAFLSTALKTESGWSARIDSLRMLWYRRVINFDQSDQEEVAKAVAQFGRDWLVWIRTHAFETWQALKAWFTRPMGLFRWAAVGAGLLALAALWRWRRIWQNAWMRLSGWGLFAKMQREHPVRRSAGRWLLRFLPVWRTRAAAQPAPARGDWDDVRYNLLALRYGPLDALPDPAQTFRRAQNLLRAARRER